MQKIILVLVTLITLFTGGCINTKLYYQNNLEYVKNKNEHNYVTTTEPFGSFDNPVRCEGPSGERRYLNRLRDSDGNPFIFKRICSLCIGPYGHIIDKYLIKTRDNKKEYEIFMDMYYSEYIESKAAYDLNLLIDYISFITYGQNDSVSFNDLRFAWEATEDFDIQHYDDDIEKMFQMIENKKFKKAQRLITELNRIYPISSDLIYADFLCKKALGMGTEKELQKIEQLRRSIMNGNDGTSINSAITVINYPEIKFILYVINNYEILDES